MRKRNRTLKLPWMELKVTRTELTKTIKSNATESTKESNFSTINELIELGNIIVQIKSELDVTDPSGFLNILKELCNY